MGSFSKKRTLDMRLLIIFLVQLARGSPRSRCIPIEHSCSLEADGIVFHVKANECLKQRNISTRNLFVNSIGNNEEGCRFIGNDARFTTKQVCYQCYFLFNI